MIVYWHDNVVCLSVCLYVTLCIVAKHSIDLAKLSEEVNRKCLRRNTILQLSALLQYIDAEPSNSDLLHGAHHKHQCHLAYKLKYT